MKFRIGAKNFLAVLIVALVGVSAAYLVHTPGIKKPPAPVKEVKTDKAEVLIDGFRFAESDDGRGSWELNARRAEMKKDTGMARLDDLVATFNAKDGNVLTLTADEGSFDSNTKAVRLSRREKDIVVVSNKGYRMTARDLSWDNENRELRTDDKVRLDGRNVSIEGRGLVASTDLQEVRITNGVRTVFTQKR